MDVAVIEIIKHSHDDNYIFIRYGQYNSDEVGETGVGWPSLPPAYTVCRVNGLEFSFRLQIVIRPYWLLIQDS